MKIGILGTGIVGKSHAEKLVSLGHEVMMGTRDEKQAGDPEKKDLMGTVFSEWKQKHPKIKVASFPETAQHGEIIINALKGEISVSVLKTLSEYLVGKVVIDLSNPLDFSKGSPPSLFVCNTDSLGEQIQRALPQTHIVKTFNTMNAMLQVNPQTLAQGDHQIFVSGNEQSAKSRVIELLRSYGWRHILDLGDISTARGTEMMLPLWLRLWNALQSPMFNMKVVTE